MRTIPIQAVPNQELSVTVENLRFVITLKEARGVMVADVALDGVTLLRGTRLLAGEAVIPYRYLENGNFYLLTDEGRLPDYRRFNASQQLVYLTADEMAAIRG